VTRQQSHGDGLSGDGLSDPGDPTARPDGQLMADVTAGRRLRSTVCATEVIVVRAPNVPVDLSSASPDAAPRKGRQLPAVAVMRVYLRGSSCGPAH
jgi:hypothetical protein